MKDIKEWIDESGKLYSGESLGSKNGFEVIDNKSRGFKHVVPIPTEDFLKEYYKNNWVENRPDNFYEKVESDFEWFRIFYDENYDTFDKYIDKDKKSILDIGSGLGFFLKVGKDRGWETLGIEPSVESYNYSKKHGIGLKNEFFNRENYQSFGTFDAIHMHEVIEHLRDPEDMIQMAYEILNPGGVICIVSPNEFNPLQLSYVSSEDQEKWWIAAPEHINYFDFNSINFLLQNNGFECLEQTSTFPLEIFLLMGDKYIGNGDIGNEIHNKRVNLEMNLHKTGNEDFRRNLYKKFSEIGIGREFVIFARKPK